MTRFEPQESMKNGFSGRDAIEIGVCTVSGLILGAAAMYLFDPKAGAKRRQSLTEAAGSAIQSATGSLSSAGRYLRDSASGLTDGAPAYARSARRSIDHLSDRARGYLGMERRRQFPVAATATVSSVGLLALGLGYLYFFNPMNPERSRARRQSLMDFGARALSESGRVARMTGEYLRTGGQKAMSMVPGMGELTDEQLTGNVQDAIRQIAPDENIDVQCRNGEVSLRGQVKPGMVSAVNDAVRKVSGVTDLRSELRAYDIASRSAVEDYPTITP